MANTDWDEVATFAHAMRERLRANDHKGGWQHMHPRTLLNRSIGELEELSEELFPADRKRNPERVLREAADAANYAMMVADVCGALDAAVGDRRSGVGVYKGYQNALADMRDAIGRLEGSAYWDNEFAGGRPRQPPEGLEREHRSDGWIIEDYGSVRLACCPDCAFSFDACHEDEPNGGYTCPICETAAPTPEDDDGE